MTTIADWLVLLDLFRLLSAVFATGLTVTELMDCHQDLKSSGTRRAERIVAETNIVNDLCRLVVCLVFVWLAITSLVFPPQGSWYGVMFVNRISLLIATFAMMYKSWRDRHLRKQLYAVWQRERMLRPRRIEDYADEPHD